MPQSNNYTVSLSSCAPRTIAAVHARLQLRDVPSNFRQFLDQVYAAARTGSVHLDGQNVFIYREIPNSPDEADIAFGVGAKRPFATSGNVQSTLVPAGVAATTTHWGSYAGLGHAHEAIIEWCRLNGHRRAGARWEVYGHWTDEEAKVRTDVFYLLASDSSDSSEARTYAAS